MKSPFKTILLYILIIGVVIVIASVILGNANKAQVIKYSDLINLFKNNEVAEFTIGSNDVLSVQKTNNTTVTRKLRDINRFLDDVKPYLNNSALKGYEIAEPKSTSWLLSFLPYIIFAVLLILFWVFMMNRAGGGAQIQNFGKSRAKPVVDTKNAKHFSDVAGADEEKEELMEVVEYLKDPQKFTKLGAKIPRGILLVGPPGTGKTLLAKAVAGEANVPFLSISGSDFVEMYVGVGASRVRDLFETAKKANSSIIFIDEIDAVGRHRGAGLGGGHDEREQTLNQLLVEMDGFNTHDGVIVIAATNRPDILDPALLRPGRFDRQVTVGLPDIKGREQILRVHAIGKPFENDVDMKRIAQITVGFTGADLANLLNESALLAARKGKSLIGNKDIEDSLIKISVGTQKKSHKIKDSEKRKIAYHEAGHAILSYVLPTQDTVRQISVIPSGGALGYTISTPDEDIYNVYKNQLTEKISMLLGGRAAEKLVYNDVSGGASNDIQRATGIARKMVTTYGMSEALGTIHFGGDHTSDEVFLGRDFNNTQNYSEQTASLIDAEIKKIIDEAYKRALDILTEYREKLDFVADFLMKNEIMSDDEFKLAMEGASMEELEKLAEERRKQSESENKVQEQRWTAEKEREAAENARRAAAEKEQQKQSEPKYPWEV